MWEGEVVSIHICETSGAPMVSPQEVRAVAGRGLEGDRYFLEKGFYSDDPGPDRELTLIEIEAIEALERDYGACISPGDARRNVVTRGVPLNHLVGQKFRAGEVLLRGIRLCEPCAHMADLAHEKALPGLVHRGGLRAEIVKGGVIRIGDVVGSV